MIEVWGFCPSFVLGGTLREAVGYSKASIATRLRHVAKFLKRRLSNVEKSAGEKM